MSKGIAISLLYLKYTTFVTVNSTGEIIPCAFNKCNNCAVVDCNLPQKEKEGSTIGK